MGQQNSKNREKLLRKDQLSKDGKSKDAKKKVKLHDKLHSQLLGRNHRSRSIDESVPKNGPASGYYTPHAQSRRKFLGTLGFSETPETVGKSRYGQNPPMGQVNFQNTDTVERSRSISDVRE